MEIVKTLTIYESDNYDLLYNGLYNRIGKDEKEFIENYGVKNLMKFKNRVRVLMEIIYQNGYDIYQPIIVWKNSDKKRLEILDGQGRYAACRNLNRSYWYTVHTDITNENEASEYVRIINNTRCNWSLTDKISVLGNSSNNEWNKNYRKIIELENDLKCGLSNAAMVLYGCGATKSRNIVNLKLVNNPNSGTAARVLKTCRDMNLPFWKKTRFVEAVIKTCNNRDFNAKMEGKFYQKILTKKHQVTTREYLEMFHNMLNENYHTNQINLIGTR
jgi:hypothetical protein